MGSRMVMLIEPSGSTTRVTFGGSTTGAGGGLMGRGAGPGLPSPGGAAGMGLDGAQADRAMQMIKTFFIQSSDSLWLQMVTPRLPHFRQLLTVGMVEPTTMVAGSFSVTDPAGAPHFAHLA